MSSARLARLVILFWGTIFAIICAVFFLGGGPTSFAADSSRIAMGAVAYGAGLAANLWLVTRARRTRAGALPIRDERDDAIEQTASVATVVFILVVTYASGIALWVAYQDSGVVPVGWLWFIAHAIVALGAIAQGVSQLVVATRMGGHA